MSGGFDLFFDYFARRDNRLRRFDPRVKMGVVAALFAAILLSTRPPLPAMVSVVALGSLLLIGIPLGLIGRRLLAPLGIVIALVLIQGLLVGETVLAAFPVAGWEVALHREGLVRGAGMALRVWGAFSVLLLFSAVTPAHEMFRALRWCRMPHLWVEIAMLVYRYIFVLLEEASEMVAAQRVRLGYAGFGNGLRSAGTLTGAVVVRAMEQSLRTHEAMVARGYTDVFPFGPLPPMGRRAWGALAGVVAVVGILYWFLERGLA
ncbi:MAG: cobalt ECF transporter T component CbiQ [Desulfatitalea sp.]|nr:cobalt ECF transporter T component CbiQ [Desulfatitalea sp.]